MGKEISDIAEISSFSRWDGSHKDLTKNCPGCNYYRKDDRGELCYWGVAAKVLVEPKKYRACSLLKQASPRIERIRLYKGIKEIERTLRRIKRIADFDYVSGRSEGYKHA
jgi:hypothetical protein